MLLPRPEISTETRLLSPCISCIVRCGPCFSGTPHAGWPANRATARAARDTSDHAWLFTGLLQPRNQGVGIGRTDDRHHPDPAIERARHFFCCDRSEEHTSELQSLMRISYAVFCLKKKHTITT